MKAPALLDRVKNSVTGELSDDDLEAVAGGNMTDALDDLKEMIGGWFGK